MILADKIIHLRKKSGWSQEELADRLGVSRQSVSKWESAASIPDLNKILKMSQIFGVSTDYLLKDEIESEEFVDYVDETEDSKAVAVEDVYAYLEAMERSSLLVSIGVVLCILSPAPLMLLLGISTMYGISENLACGIGVVVLLVMVAIAVAIFIFSGTYVAPYQYVKEGSFHLQYGVRGVVEELKVKAQPMATAGIVIGVVLCILSAVPLLIVSVLELSDGIIICMVAMLLLIVAIGVFLIIYSQRTNEVCKQFLKQEEYNEVERERNRPVAVFNGIFWPCTVAVYLLLSFLTARWDITWLVWPVAAMMDSAVSTWLKRKQ